MNREKSIELLNAAVGDELAAVHQYLSHFAEFEKHLDNINEFGRNYLALQSMGGSEPETKVVS
jgi:hypothetical protein